MITKDAVFKVPNNNTEYGNIYKGYIQDHAGRMEEEDRLYDNNLKKAKTKYYDTESAINSIILETLRSMTLEERKEMIKNNMRISVVERIK